MQDKTQTTASCDGCGKQFSATIEHVYCQKCDPYRYFTSNDDQPDNELVRDDGQLGMGA